MLLLEPGPRILQLTVADHGVDADQANPLEPPADPHLYPIGPELAHEPGREPSLDGADLLGLETGDLAEGEPDDPAEAPEPDLASLEPEPVDLEHHAAREMEEMRPIGQGGRRRRRWRHRPAPPRAVPRPGCQHRPPRA